MKSSHRHLFAAALLLVIDLAMAQSTQPDDWRLYSFSKEPNAQAIFFLYSEILRNPNGHVQVWIKLLDREKLEDFTATVFKEHRDLVQRAKDKEASYMPPYATVKKLSPEELVSVRIYEQIADAGSIPPTLRGLFEIDCGQKLYRELVALAADASNNEVTPWKHVPPESTVKTLSNLTCQR